MRQLRAELIKLNRPLTWAVFMVAAAFCVLLAVAGASNAARWQDSSDATNTSCRNLRLPPGPACGQVQHERRQRAAAELANGRAAAAATAAQLDPMAAGAEAAGLMASLPGAVAVALLAGGHIGGEWSGRTLKNVLTQAGRRRRVLLAKLISLWAAGAGLIAACWAALAVAGPLIRGADHLPDPHQSLGEAASLAGSQIGRSLLVLAAFAAIGLLAAVVTRGTIGTMATTTAAVIAMLIAAALPGLGAWTPATWVQGWMDFGAGQASKTSLPNNFWSRFISADGVQLGQGTGLVGVVCLLLGCVLTATWLFRRSDVTG